MNLSDTTPIQAALAASAVRLSSIHSRDLLQDKARNDALKHALAGCHFDFSGNVSISRHWRTDQIRQFCRPSRQARCHACRRKHQQIRESGGSAYSAEAGRSRVSKSIKLKLPKPNVGFTHASKPFEVAGGGVI